MGRYAVYGADTITPLKTFGTREDAIAYAQKWIRVQGKTVKDTERKNKLIYRVWKTNTRTIKEMIYE